MTALMQTIRDIATGARFKTSNRRARRAIRAEQAAPRSVLGRMKRRAYSLVEILLGAAVLAAFIVRVYQSYAATSAADKFEDFNSEISLIAGSTIQQFINAPNYAGVSSTGTDGTTTTNSVITAVLPSKYIDPTTQGILDVYHGSVIVQTADAVTQGDTAAFAITASNVPNDACLKSAGQDFGKNFLDYTATATIPEPPFADAPGSTGAQADASTNCSGDANSITYVVK